MMRERNEAKKWTRREALKLGGLAGGALAAGVLPSRKTFAEGKPEKTDLTLGFIPLKY